MRGHSAKITMFDKLLSTCVNCSFGLIFCLKESIGKVKVTGTLGERTVKKRQGEKPVYSRACKKADFKKKAEGKNTCRNPSYVHLLTFNSVSCTLTLVFYVPHFSPARNPLVILHRAFLKASPNITFVPF